MTSKPIEVRVPIAELDYIGWAKIETNGHRRQVSSHINNPAYTGQHAPYTQLSSASKVSNVPKLKIS